MKITKNDWIGFILPYEAGWFCAFTKKTYPAVLLSYKMPHGWYRYKDRKKDHRKKCRASSSTSTL
jgi:hypothetical protein